MSLPSSSDSPRDSAHHDLSHRQVISDLHGFDINEVYEKAEAEQGEIIDSPLEAPPLASTAIPPIQARPCNVVVDLPTTTLINPRSVFEPFEPPAPPTTEAQALQSLLGANHAIPSDEDFTEVELDNFSCYIITDQFPFEMRALHDHATRSGKQTFYFDGILRVGQAEYFVQRVEFEEIPLGNYGDSEPTVGDQIWIRSRLNAEREVYYQLNNPALEYARFHKPFLWVADLAKHMFEFCTQMLERKKSVSIHDFKTDFGTWLQKKYKKSPIFLNWYAQRQSNDFRHSIIANEPFLRKEMYGVFSTSQFKRLDVFREITNPFKFYPRIGDIPGKKVVPYTVVTPYVHDLFSGMDLGGLLKAVEPTISQDARIKSSWPTTQLQNLRYVRQPRKSASHQDMVANVSVGDLISTVPDEEGSGSKWMTERADKKWYGLVQKKHLNPKNGKRRFDVIWLYQPEDTPCCSMRYPWTNELFLSEHCTCQQSMAAKIAGDEILGVHSVEWFGSPEARTDFFVRQTYHTGERRFITLESGHLRCDHKAAKPAPEYGAGETVLVSTPCSQFLEPHEILDYTEQDRTATLRVLARRKNFVGHGDAAVNELVYTDDIVQLPTDKIATRCIIRFYSPGESIPAPYNRNGTGNAFFISHRQCAHGTLEPLSSANRPPLRQGFDPTKPVKKLRALDLFCGCGNFGRGLEDGGAVEAKWANDIWEAAIHTYMANAAPNTVEPFLGSIDDLLLRAFEGKFGPAVPEPGQVEVVSGGTPCPGFSLITSDKTTLEQKKNRSLVASFASCIDYWRPAWGLLENVRNIVQSKKNRTEDFFSQLICALVGMGYQCQIILGEAWAYGCPQQRVRVFLYFAAPGVTLPSAPYPSHWIKGDRIGTASLGQMANGEPYITRPADLPVAFKHVTAGEATADLPDIADAKPDTCISFPDHRLSIGISSSSNQRQRLRGELIIQPKNKRTQIANIPTTPWGMNFAKAYYDPKTPEGEPDMFPHERDAFPPVIPGRRSERILPGSKGWGRAHPKKLFVTVTTFCHMTDARIGGNLLHWTQMRPLSVMEVRRAQGLPDDEVLLGGPRDQWEMVGNGVARGVSTTLGLALREAAFGTLYEDGGKEALPVLGGGCAISTARSTTMQENGNADRLAWDRDSNYRHAEEEEASLLLRPGSQSYNHNDSDDISNLLAIVTAAQQQQQQQDSSGAAYEAAFGGESHISSAFHDEFLHNASAYFSNIAAPSLGMSTLSTTDSTPPPVHHQAHSAHTHNKRGVSWSAAPEEDEMLQPFGSKRIRVEEAHRNKGNYNDGAVEQQSMAPGEETLHTTASGATVVRLDD